MPQNQGELEGDQQFVTFQVSWQQGTWRVTFHPQGQSPFDDPNCITTVSTVVQDPRFHRADQFHWTFLSSTNRAQGCLAVMQSGNAVGVAPSSYFSQAALLYRFGVLLTANEIAFQQWPQLPQATQDEQRLAQDILNHPAFVS